MKQFELVIVGGGLAAARAVETYREAGGGGRVALLSKEPVPPYHRPPLSKRYLRGETSDAPFVKDDAFYRDNEVELLLATEVVSVDPGAREVGTADGDRYRYCKLLLATGAIPRRLEVEGADLPGVFTLRTLDDANTVREAAAQTRDAVVIGSGFIGMETAASLTQLGLDVTLVSRDIDLFAQLRSPDVSEHLIDIYRQRGVDVVRGDEVRAFLGRSRLDTVELHSGEPIGAGLAVVGIGVRPAAGFLAGSGIELDDGVVVTERFETNLPDVYAVGDLAHFPDPLFGRRRRIEHWSNADYQGREVGRVLAGADGGYATVSTFFTESFGLTLKVFGDTSRHDERVARGSFAEGDAIVFYFDDGRLVGTLHAGQDEEAEQTLKRLIAVGARLDDLPLLRDASAPVDELLAGAVGS